MLPANVHSSDYQIPVTNPILNTGANNSSNWTRRSAKINANEIDTTPLATRLCRLTRHLCCLHVSASPNQADDYSPTKRAQLGGKGMFLRRMQEVKLRVPPFQCVTARVMNALEQHPLDTRRFTPHFSGITDEPCAKTSLAAIRERLNALPPAEQAKRADWLATFVASSDFYQQVKDSLAARHIRVLRDRLSTAKPVIVRSSGINEDNYGDAQAGKYLSEVQGDDDVLQTCLNVMASGYRPELCTPMALIIQQCIDCRYGGVAMSYQSFQDDTVRVEYTSGQPRGIVGGQCGNTPHRIDIDRQAVAGNIQYIPGTISSHFILHKNADNSGYSETAMAADTQANGGGHRLSNKLVKELRQAVTRLEDLLLCPVDVEFAIDHKGRLFLLQVRPVTRLPGGMDFAMSAPEEPLASGEGVSEGYGSGELWLANKQAADTMPDGAIVVAQHAGEWMLEPGFLERAGGLVLGEGGSTDHVVITLRQKGIPLILVGGQYPTVVAQVGQQVTLACARFDGSPAAFIVTGDITEKLAAHRSPSPAFSDVPLTKAIPSRDALSPPEGTFHQVNSGFQWLTDQNARLLAFFAPGGGLDCLANPVKLSMSPQRSKLVAATRDSVNRLVYGAEALLEGYRAFLLLAGNHSSPRLQSLQDELPLLTTRFEALKQTISSRLETIIHPLHADEALPLPKGMFGQWMAACHQLQSCLQALNRPKVEQVRSVHDLIFALHSRFVEALAPVTLASGQGRLSTTTYINHVDCTTPGSEKVPLLTPTTKAYIEASLFRGVVINMDDALIVNLSFGGHVGIIELLENAEGGKGRTLRLKFSDLGYKYQPGKVKRMWFLVQLLKAIGLDENSDNMKLSCNAAAGGIIVECAQMKSKKDMQIACEKLLTAIYALSDLDVYMQDIAVFEEDPSHWSFGLLVQRLDSDFTTEVERFAFQHYLFSMAYKFPSAYRRIQRTNSDSYQLSGCYQFLSYHHQQLIDHSRRLAECAKQSDDHLREMFMSDEINEVIRRELLHHLLLSDYKNATPLVDLVYDLVGECFVIEPSYCYHPVFKIPPGQPFSDHKEKVRDILLKQGLQYASQRLRNDKDLVLSIIAKYPDDLECVSRELKNDKDVVMTAIKQRGHLLQYASPECQDNDEIVVAAIKQSGSALEYASDRIRSDKNIIQIVIADKVRFLKFASKTLLKDREYILGLIKHTPRALMYVDDSLERDDTFLRSAIRTNPEVINKCWALSHKLKRLAQKSQCS